MTHNPAMDPATQATLIQREAADPNRSAVLRASAGSGKTKVLVDRILRLTLTGAPLKSIVALTFTRKAAVEIKERLLAKIKKLTLADEESRRKLLTDLLGIEPTIDMMERSALLFTEILEDTNGLLIGTIHTFCQTLLSRFADYADLDPAFTILERTDQLWEEAFQKLEQGIAGNRGAGYRLRFRQTAKLGSSRPLPMIFGHWAGWRRPSSRRVPTPTLDRIFARS